jgi:hypothetical protein
MPDIYQNIIMRIGTQMGPGGLASLKAGSDMILGLATNVIGVVEQLDKFKDMAATLDMKLISMAASTSDGQIKTENLISTLATMNEVLKPTAEQFAAISRGAAYYADKTGRDANEVFGTLTDSIMRASDRGLKPFGIDLKGTGTLLEKQQEALKAVSSAFSGVEFKADTFSDSLTKTKNAFTMLTGTIWSSSQGIGVFSVMSTILDELSADMASYTDQIQRTTTAEADWIKEHGGLIAAIESGTNATNTMAQESMSVFEMVFPMWSAYKRGMQGAADFSTMIDSIMNPNNYAKQTAPRGKNASELAREWGEAEKLLAQYRAEESGRSFYPEEWEQGQSIEGIDTGFYDTVNPYQEGGGGSSKYVPQFGIDVLPEVAIWAKAKGLPYTTYEERDSANKAYLRERIANRKEYEDAVAEAQREFSDQRSAAAFSELSANSKNQERIDRLEIERAKKESEMISKISGTNFKGDLRDYYNEVTQQAKTALRAGTIGRESYDSLINQSPTAVSDQIAIMEEVESAKENAYQNWLNRVGTERIWQLEQIQFANDWKAVWENSLNSVTAGTMTAQTAHDLLRGTWNATIDAAITGKKTFAQAVRTMVAEIGMAVAKEAGWQALMNAAFAVYSLAKRDYSAAAEYGAAAIMFGALATTAGVAARAMQPKGKAAGGSVSSPSRSSAQYGTTYPSGGMSQQDKVQVNVYLEGEAKGVFKIVKTENESRARSGQSSFQAA